MSLKEITHYYELSDQPGEALLQTLDNIKILEKEPDYRIIMSWWLSIETSGVCQTCLAMSAFAGTQALEDRKAYNNLTRSFLRSFMVPSDFPEFAHKLKAIEYFRTGDIKVGLGYFFKKEDAFYFQLHDFREIEMNFDRHYRRQSYPSYSDNPIVFKKIMKDMGEYLLSFPFKKDGSIL